MLDIKGVAVKSHGRLREGDIVTVTARVGGFYFVKTAQVAFSIPVDFIKLESENE